MALIHIKAEVENIGLECIGELRVQCIVAFCLKGNAGAQGMKSTRELEVHTAQEASSFYSVTSPRLKDQH